MKIAFLNIYSGVNDRGAESFALGLANSLSRGYEVSFISGGKITGGDHLRNLLVNTRIVQPVQGFQGGLLTRLLKRLFLDGASLAVLLFSVRSMAILWRDQYDILIPLNGFWQVIVCQIVRGFRGGRIVVTGHSGPGWDERWNLYLKPDVFVATTEPAARWARKTCFYCRVEMIPYGIDLENFASAEPVMLNQERPLILCPAAAVPYKRVDLSVRAVAMMKSGSLVHLGSGPLSKELLNFGEELLGPRYISREVTYSGMPGYYAASDVVTLASTGQENSPMVFLEAMAAGRAVVTTDTERSRWLLGQAGVFIEPGDIRGYARALLEGVRMKNKKEIRLQAKKYSWEIIGGKYEKLLLSLH